MNAITPASPTVAAALQLHGALRLTHLGVLELSGEDAVRFIHGQLTHDFALLGPERARLAAFCSAKGRMLASFIGIKPAADRVLLVCSADLVAAMQKRLSMFVLRAKVKVRDANADYALWGRLGAAADAPLAALPLWSAVASDGGYAIRLYPADGAERQLVICPADAQPAFAALHPALSLQTWQWAEVRSGVATLTQPVSDRFVPQMLNYESVDGVNFKKGCYPGQEVVARSQFRGTLKRRGFVAHVDGPVQAGDEVFAEHDADQPVGTVAQAAPVPDGTGSDAIVSLQLSALESPSLRVASAGGAALQLLPLPYALLDDI